MQFEGGESCEEFKRDCLRMVNHVNNDNQDFENSMSAALFESVNNHITKIWSLNA